jgi:STE24 endopeptidase
MLNPYLVIIVGLILVRYVLNLVSERLNLAHVTSKLPEEFKGWYEEEAYAKSQRYLRETTRFDLLESTILVPVGLAFLLLGGFHWADQMARAAGGGMILTGLLFTGILVLLSELARLPFSAYSTFVLEARYGFNKTTPGTFAADFFKSLALTAVLGGAALSLVLWFFAAAGPLAWVYSWIAVTALQLALAFVAPVWILPLFNKLTPLEDGDLKQAIEAYAREQGFTLKGLFTMDGSKRSTKSNAFFTGFGRWRRIVLYDTLVEKHSVEELVSVLAHEVGHWKLRHIRKHLIASTLVMGVMFYALSVFISRPGLYAAFRVEMTPIGGQAPIYAGLVFFLYLFAPMSLLLSPLLNLMSRRHEFQADAFAVMTCRTRDAMIDALKRLSVDNLVNLTPHPFKVALEYSHPPMLARIRAIREVPVDDAGTTTDSR